MKWSNLRNNKCPSCNRQLYGANGVIVCSNTKCSFRVTEERMTEIVMDRNGKELEKPDVHSDTEAGFGR